MKKYACDKNSLKLFVTSREQADISLSIWRQIEIISNDNNILINILRSTNKLNVVFE